MSQLTNIPLQDNYKSTLSQAWDGNVGTIYVNTVPSFTFPAGVKTYICVDPGKTNMQVARISAYDATLKTITVDSITADKGNGVAYTAQTHTVGSVIEISDNYQFREDIQTAINTKVNSDGDSIITDGNLTFAGSASKYGVAVKELTTAQIAALSSPPNGSAVVDSTLGAFQVKIGGSFQSMGAGATTSNASTTVAGKVEKATSGEVTTGTSTGGTGAELFVGPAELKVVTDGLSDDITNSLIISAYFGNGSDGDVTINSGTTTLTRDMYYNNLIITSPGVLDPAGYRVFVKGTLSGNGTIRRNGNNGTAGGTYPTGNNPGVAGAVLNQGSLNMERAGGNGGARSTGAANSGVAGTSSSPSMTNINGVAGGNNGSGGGAGSAGTATRGTLYNIYGYPQSMHLATATATFAGLQYLSIPGSGGGAGSAGSGGAAAGAGGGAGGNGGFIRLACFEFNFTGTVSATGGTGGAGGTSAGGGGGGNGGIFFRVYRTLTNDCTKTLTGGAGGAGGGAGILPAGSAGTTGNAGETISIVI